MPSGSRLFSARAPIGRKKEKELERKRERRHRSADDEQGKGRKKGRKNQGQEEASRTAVDALRLRSKGGERASEKCGLR